MATHEQQTRIPTIAAMIFGADEAWLLVSIKSASLKYFAHLTLNS
jgi:hypothetical protein